MHTALPCLHIMLAAYTTSDIPPQQQQSSTGLCNNQSCAWNIGTNTQIVSASSHSYLIWWQLAKTISRSWHMGQKPTLERSIDKRIHTLTYSTCEHLQRAIINKQHQRFLQVLCHLCMSCMHDKHGRLTLVHDSKMTSDGRSVNKHLAKIIGTSK